MLERHVTFDVDPGMGADFEYFFIMKSRPAMASMPGFVKVDLIRQQDVPEKYRMEIRFETPKADIGWRSSDLHKTLSPSLKAMFSKNQQDIFEIIE